MATTTFRAVLQPNANTQGLHNLLIRIYHNQNRKYARTAIFIRKSEFDSKKGKVIRHPDAEEYNDFIDEIIREAQRILLKKKRERKRISHEQLKDIIEGNYQEGETYLFSYLDQYISLNFDLIENRKRRQTFVDLLRIFRDYRRNKDISLYDINTSEIQRFKAYLSENYANSTSNLHIRSLKQLLTYARKDSSIDYKEDPFYNIKKLREQVNDRRRSLTEEEVIRLERYKPERELEKDAINVFLACFYLGGSRISEAVCLTVRDLMSGKFRAKKTTKRTYIIIHSKLESLLAPYLAGKSDKEFVFPFMAGYQLGSLEFEEQIGRTISNVNYYLKKTQSKLSIGVNLSTRVARVTFANRVAELQDTNTAQIILNHSSKKVTERYLDIENLDQLPVITSAIETVFR